jgi:hypothetical protein
VENRSFDFGLIYLIVQLSLKKRDKKGKMTKADLIKELSFIKNTKRIYRENAADFICKYPETFAYLLKLVFDKQSKQNIKATWVLEIVCLKNLHLIIPYLDYFTKSLKKISDESALRPLSKICAFLSKSYFLKKDSFINTKLTEKQKERIVENSFDWLIEEHKVATQVFSMDTLYLMGKEYDWIHKELKLILQKNASSGSAGYQVHARNILKKI